ncbi:MAG: metallopeptidase [Lachnospiraceae bacterium]|nr:metallopeptidase [Lachnospiraceae bacterium]
MGNLPLEELGNEILSTARNEIYLSMRFLDVALAGLSFSLNPGISSTATDGDTLYFQPRYLLTAYEENPVLVNRAYLHNLLHCIFSHLYLPPMEDGNLWRLCCDICVESIVDSLPVSCLQKLPSPLREKTYQHLNQSCALYTPARLYRILENSVFYRQNMILLEQDFCIDSHEFWPRKKENSDTDSPQEREKQQKQETKWQEIGEKTRTGMETFERQAGTEAGTLLQVLKTSQEHSPGYETFLRRFAAWHETIRLNDEEFDTAFYTLGMDLYGNIPLVEPLEYKEEKKIRELVIAIDTSGSVQGTPVKRFLAKTFDILKSSRHFLKHMELRLLQFDTVIQEELRITDMKQLEALSESITVRGFGGTDYRCVFRHVAELQERGQLNRLQGLMILTDGYGTYPSEPPGYPAAFLLADFLRENRFRTGEPAWERVPAWAIKLRLKENEWRMEHESI